MTPTRTHTHTDSPLGPLTLVAEDGALCGVYFSDHLRRPPADAFGTQDPSALSNAVRQLAEYFAGERQLFDLPLAVSGTPFQRRVWERVAQIPYGATATYAEIAADLGDRHWAHPVGAAVGRNPVCIVVGCHRAVSSSGKLVGYAGGLERKQYLLDFERSRVEAAEPVPA